MNALQILVLLCVLLSRVVVGLQCTDCNTCYAFDNASLVNCVNQANSLLFNEFTSSASAKFTIDLGSNAIFVESTTEISNPNRLIQIQHGALVGNNSFPILQIDSGAQVLLFRVAIQNGSNGGDNSIAGGINNYGYLNLYKSKVLQNTGSDSGGGIYNEGQLYLDKSIIKENTAVLGGGIYSLNYANITKSTIENNSAAGNGGGIYAQNSFLTMKDAIVSNNSSVSNGAGIYLYSVEAQISASAILQNSTLGDGGGIAIFFSLLETDTSVISQNMASFFGGGIFAFGAELLLYKSKLLNNSASSGGGLDAAGSLVKLGESTVDSNVANFGGGLGIEEGTQAIIYGSTISNNSASSNGGGIFKAATTSFSSEIDIYNSTISGNTADTSGGGFYIDVSTSSPPSTVNMTNNTVAFNDAITGGGIYIASPPTQIINFISNIVADNSAATGPDIYSAGLAIFGTTVTYNLIGNTSGTNALQWANITNITGVNPLLGPLADNGGPTLTHAINFLSPAYNTGANPENFVNDQRGPRYVGIGYTRVFAGKPDIGAFEYQFFGVGDFNMNDP
jgi:predicted outer membrane repeat protein